MKRTRQNSEKYTWGTDCLGWHLVNNPQLSVILEHMPPDTSEVKHKHQRAQQFFFILKGVATFDLDGEMILVRENEGIHVKKDQVHQITNNTNNDLEFLVISHPHSHKDRVYCIIMISICTK